MLYYSYGTALLTADEARDLEAKEKVDELVRASSRGRAASRSIDLLNGSFSTDMLGGGSTALETERAAADWEPIGPGKPLTIDIREVYTGKHPGGFLGGAKPMLFTSAVKSIATFEAKPRAINFLVGKVKKKSRLSRPKASEDGTPVIFYSPAVIDRSLTLDVSIVFDEFPKEAFEAVGSAFKAAAGVPIFLAHSTYLLAAGEIARLAGAAGEGVFDGKPALDTSESIDLDLPGEEPTLAGFMVVTPADVDRVDSTFRETYQVVKGTLVDKAGKPYAGDIPYVVLAVDGTPREDLINFAPTAASAAVLSRFYGIKNGQSLSLDLLVDALKLYNDLNYRSELDKIDKRLASMKDGPEKEKLKEKREALLKNIMTDLLKPGGS